jgi:predicted acylesterase/phospholipase RssA
MAATPRKQLTVEDVTYIAFEGGGGKGFAFLGALKALEELEIIRHVELRPEEPGFERAKLPWQMPPEVPARRVIDIASSIKGVSGASAGAITALLVSCGYSSSDILAIMQEYEFDQLFERPNPRYVPRIQIEHDPRTYRGAVEVRDPPVESETFRRVRRDLLRTLFPPLAATEGLADAAWRTAVNSFPGFAARVLLRAKLPAAYRMLLDYFKEYIDYLPSDMGFFPGHKARELFAELIAFKMPRRDGRLQYNATFEDHEKYFQLKLAVTGTNLETGKSGIFSPNTTPHFPVADAVRISMSLPLAYKPVVIRPEHYRKGLFKDWVNGVWMDGGYLNNMPLRAFDEHGGIGRTLGLRLDVDPKPEKIETLWDFLKVWPLAFGFLGAGEAHIGPGTSSDLETIVLKTDGLDLLVFSPPPDVVERVTKSSHASVMEYFPGL